MRSFLRRRGVPYPRREAEAADWTEACTGGRPCEGRRGEKEWRRLPDLWSVHTVNCNHFCPFIPSFLQFVRMISAVLAALVLVGPVVTSAFDLPDFSWDVTPRFVHCGPDYKPPDPTKPARLPLSEIYQKMSTFPMATLEKFTLQTEAPANIHEEAKILEAARCTVAPTVARDCCSDCCCRLLHCCTAAQAHQES